jgi:hypothetical protein
MRLKHFFLMSKVGNVPSSFLKMGPDDNLDRFRTKFDTGQVGMLALNNDGGQYAEGFIFQNPTGM